MNFPVQHIAEMAVIIFEAVHLAQPVIISHLPGGRGLTFSALDDALKISAFGLQISFDVFYDLQLRIISFPIFIQIINLYGDQNTDDDQKDFPGRVDDVTLEFSLGNKRVSELSEYWFHGLRAFFGR
jgi:hypothetical protein